MTQPTIISEKAVDIYEVKEELAAIEKKEGELSFRSQKTKEYLEDVSQMDDAKAKAAREAIAALDIPRFKDEYVAKIIDIKPLSVADLKQLVLTFGVTVKDDNLKQIIDILNK
jgi:DNA-directed RNA polymerase subunit F